MGQITHTLTTDDVKAIHDRLKHRGPRDAYLGTRTEVHEALQAQCPPQYTSFPDHLPMDRHAKFTRAELAEIHAHQRAQVTDAEILASERARAGVDGDHRDAHHYVQKQHGIALWKEADRLIAAAGITDTGA